MPVETTVTMSTKGQVVIPREIREQLGWGAGTRLEVKSHAGGIALRPARVFTESRVEDVLGLLKYSGPPKTLEEMNDAVAEGALESARRAR